LAHALLKEQRLALLRKISETYPPTCVWRAANAGELQAGNNRRWKLHLQEVFGDSNAAFVSAVDINANVLGRHEDSAKNETINREMAFLHRAFQIGDEARPRLVPNVPVSRQAAGVRTHWFC
jgi:hypothetical protein